MLTPHEIADKIWDSSDIEIIEIDERVVQIIKDNNTDDLGELQITDLLEKYLQTVIRILEEKVNECITNDRNPRFSFSEQAKYRIIGSANLGNRSLLIQLVADIVSSIVKINEITISKQKDPIFYLTETSFKCQPTFLKPIKRQSELGDFIDALYMLVYEGSSKMKKIPKIQEYLDVDGSFNEDFVIKEINNLRSFFRHDINQWDENNRNNLINRVSTICKKYTAKDSVAKLQQSDYILLQEKILTELKKALTNIESVV